MNVQYSSLNSLFSIPQNLSNIEEGEIAHFEAMLTPVGDQSMRVEWFFNGEPLKASHRVRTVYAFGMVVLEILGTKVSTESILLLFNPVLTPALYRSLW